MGWLGDKWGELTGQNQKIDPNQINSEYDTAFGTYDQGTGVGTGAMGTYGQLQQRGLDMMDPDSQFNLTQKADIYSSAADSSAEASRLAGKNAAQAGGAPAAALAAQTYGDSNKATAGAQGAYNNYLQGAMGRGVGMVSGAANNMAQMKQSKMNAFSNQRLANSRIDSQAMGFGAQILGKGLGMFSPGGAGMTLAGKLAAYGKQEGGYIGMQEGGDPQQLRDQELRNRIGQAREDSGLYSVNRNESGGIQGSSLNRHLKGTEGFEDWDKRKSLLRQSISGIESEHYGEDGAPVKGYGGGDPNRLEMNMLRQEGYISPQQGGQSMGEEARQEYDEYQKKEPSFGSGMMQEGGSVDMYQSGGYADSPYGNRGGMLSQVMGPDGIPMNIKTRIGGQTVGQ